ncbi:hypothetical protein Ct61P_15124 [Colletotrichum tofieldiae]|nr:hypothetical protein Ct61P_15124 [Colletotrichum tofieldiae]
MSTSSPRNQGSSNIYNSNSKKESVRAPQPINLSQVKRNIRRALQEKRREPVSTHNQSKDDEAVATHPDGGSPDNGVPADSALSTTDHPPPGAYPSWTDGDVANTRNTHNTSSTNHTSATMNNAVYNTRRNMTINNYFETTKDDTGTAAYSIPPAEPSQGGRNTVAGTLLSVLKTLVLGLLKVAAVSARIAAMLLLELANSGPLFWTLVASFGAQRLWAVQWPSWRSWRSWTSWSSLLSLLSWLGGNGGGGGGGGGVTMANPGAEPGADPGLSPWRAVGLAGAAAVSRAVSLGTTISTARIRAPFQGAEALRGGFDMVQTNFVNNVEAAGVLSTPGVQTAVGATGSLVHLNNAWQARLSKKMAQEDREVSLLMDEVTRFDLWKSQEVPLLYRLLPKPWQPLSKAMSTAHRQLVVYKTIISAAAAHRSSMLAWMNGWAVLPEIHIIGQQMHTIKGMASRGEERIRISGKSAGADNDDNGASQHERARQHVTSGRLLEQTLFTSGFLGELTDDISKTHECHAECVRTEHAWFEQELGMVQALIEQVYLAEVVEARLVEKTILQGLERWEHEKAYMFKGKGSDQCE